MDEIFETIWTNVFPHVPFFIYTVAFAFIGQIAKRFIWTEVHILQWRETRDALWNDTGVARVPALVLKLILATPIPLHPVFAAAFLGLFPGLWISAGLENTFFVRELYIVGAALLSLSLYDILHAVLGKRGLDFKFPGEASNPPPAPSLKEDDNTLDERRGGP